MVREIMGRLHTLSCFAKTLGPKIVRPSRWTRSCNDRFAASSLRGKLINISGELVPTLKRTDRIKLLTGGDDVFAQEKFKAGFFLQTLCQAPLHGEYNPINSRLNAGFLSPHQHHPLSQYHPTREKRSQLLPESRSKNYKRYWEGQCWSFFQALLIGIQALCWSIRRRAEQ